MFFDKIIKYYYTIIRHSNIDIELLYFYYLKAQDVIAIVILNNSIKIIELKISVF